MTILKLDYNGDGFDDVCARASTGMLCYASNAPLFRERFQQESSAPSSALNAPFHQPF